MDLDLLVLGELNPDVLVSAADIDIRFGQVEQLVDNATITLGSSGAITAAATAAQGLRAAVCAVVGDDPIGAWTTELLAGYGVDVAGVVRRAGHQTGLSIVLTRPDGDRAILTYSGTMSELSRTDVPADWLRAARHVHASSFFLQRGLQADLPALFEEARIAGATTSLDPGWAPRGEWANAGPILSQTDYLLPNAAECWHLAAALDGTSAGGDHNYHPDDKVSVMHAAKALHRLGPVVAVKLGVAGALAVGPDMLVRVRGRSVAPVDSTGAGDCFDAGFIAGLLDGSTVTEALKRAVSTGSIAVTAWGGTGRLATREQAIDAAAQLSAEHLPHPSGEADNG
jgi:sugar/nucleoside kinase (ribokinase family)